MIKLKLKQLRLSTHFSVKSTLQRDPEEGCKRPKLISFPRLIFTGLAELHFVMLASLFHVSISISSGRVSNDKNKRDCSSQTCLQYEHIQFYCPTKEWAKGVSEPVNGASIVKRAKQREALQSKWAVHVKWVTKWTIRNTFIFDWKRALHTI